MTTKFSYIFDWSNTRRKHIPKVSPKICIDLGTNSKSELDDKSWVCFVQEYLAVDVNTMAAYVKVPGKY